MKKRIISAILIVTMLIANLTACNSSKETVESIAEETIVENSTEAMEEIVEVEETTEDIVEVEPMTFEREDFTLYACVTNFGEDYSNPYNDYRLINNDYTYSSNKYMDTEIMTELANRGYDIEDFVVTWMIACNETGTWTNGELTYDYFGFDNTDEYEVKLYPIFIKYGEVDSERIIYNTNSNKEDLTEYAIRDNTDTNVYYVIHQAVADMKADENYEEINFNIPDSYFKIKTEKSLLENVSSEDSIIIKDLTLNDWYNGMIYAMFVSKTVDLDGLFDHDCTS